MQVFIEEQSIYRGARICAPRIALFDASRGKALPQLQTLARSNGIFNRVSTFTGCARSSQLHRDERASNSRSLDLRASKPFWQAAARIHHHIHRPAGATAPVSSAGVPISGGGNRTPISMVALPFATRVTRNRTAFIAGARINKRIFNNLQDSPH